MDFWCWMFVAYGLCFGIQNKLPDKVYQVGGRVQKFLRCAYCVGTHCGWMAWLISWAAQGKPLLGDWAATRLLEAGVSESGPWIWLALFASVGAISLASAAFCYGFDALTVWLETHSVTEE